MDLYERGYDAAEPVTSGARHLSAAAARLALSLLRSFTHLDEATWAELRRILTPSSLWGLCLVLMGWFVASIIGGPIGWAINALLIGLGLPEMWERLQRSWESLKAWFWTAYMAQQDADLDRAGQHCADFLAVSGITVLEFVLTHKAFKLAEGSLLKRFPVPEWLRAKYEEAVARRAAKPPTAIERLQQSTERLAKRAEPLSGALRLEGGKRLAEEFPTGAVVAGALTAVAGLGALVWAASATPRRRR